MSEKQKPEITLVDVYMGLPKEARINRRNLVMYRCGISKDTFYRWLKKPVGISPVNQEELAKVFDTDVQELFPN